MDEAEVFWDNCIDLIFLEHFDYLSLSLKRSHTSFDPIVFSHVLNDLCGKVKDLAFKTRFLNVPQSLTFWSTWISVSLFSLVDIWNDGAVPN